MGLFRRNGAGAEIIPIPPAGDLVARVERRVTSWKAILGLVAVLIAAGFSAAIYLSSFARASAVDAQANRLHVIEKRLDIVENDVAWIRETLGRWDRVGVPTAAPATQP